MISLVRVLARTVERGGSPAAKKHRRHVARVVGWLAKASAGMTTSISKQSGGRGARMADIAKDAGGADLAGIAGIARDVGEAVSHTALLVGLLAGLHAVYVSGRPENLLLQLFE